MTTVLQYTNTAWLDSSYPAAQVHRQDGRLALLQKEDDHEGEGVRWDAALSLAVDVTQLLAGERDDEQEIPGEDAGETL